MKLAVVTFTAYNQLHKRAFFEEDILMSYVIKTRIKHKFCKTAVIHDIEWHEAIKLNTVHFELQTIKIDPTHERLIELQDEKSVEIEWNKDEEE